MSIQQASATAIATRWRTEWEKMRFLYEITSRQRREERFGKQNWKKTNPELDINQLPKTINQTFPTPNIKVQCSAIDLKDQF